MTAFKRLFEPVQLRHLTLRNRIVFGAHTANMAVNGLPGDQHLAYYRERAMGGAAMLVIEPMPVHPAAVLTRGNFRHSDDSVIPHFRRITEGVKAEGAAILQQLYHVGQHGDADLSFHGHWSPSGMPSYHDSDGSHAMTEAEIEETITGFVEAARRCHEAGFDGIEMWAAYHGIADQFWTPWSNRRTDRWGGSLKNRTRFSREVMARIRRVCGEDFVIGLAVSDQPGAEVALGREALAEIVALHDREGLVDYVTCGSGGYFDFHGLMPTFVYPEKLGADLAETLKGTVTHALVTAESHIRTPENAETVLSQGQADLVSIVRGQIADPHLANKARDGRSEDIRGCLSCNQMCWGRRSRDYWISCVINPSAGREHQRGGDRFSPAETPRTVLVVGGGPAGLEAARAAAERGHEVTLAEAGPELGGRFRLAGLQPRRAQILDLIAWYERQFARLGVTILRNAPMDAEDIAAFAADRVILATGAAPDENGFQRARPALDALPGAEKGGVWTVEDVMTRAARLSGRVIVLDEGGGWRGLGTAWKLAEDGCAVTIVTPDPFVGMELQRSAADLPARRHLARLGVTLAPETALLAWTGAVARAASLLTGEEFDIEADALVLSTACFADDALANDLSDLGIPFTRIGDCAGPRQAPYAFHEGRKAGMGGMSVLVPHAELRAAAEAALIVSGASPEHAAATGRSIADAEAESAGAVGLAHLFDYCDALSAGRIDGGAPPLIERPAEAAIRIDARRGMPHLGASRALPDLAAAAKRAGVAVLALRNGYTCGALGWFARLLAEEHGLCALVAANAGPAVMPASGGREAVFCTNPLAFAAPWPGGSALVIDQSSSAAAIVAIREAADAGRPIPEGWALGPDGEPTTDAAAALQGLFLPFGGARGANIALMVELLAAGLTGANWSADAPAFNAGDASPGVGLTILAIDPGATSGGGFPAHAARFAEIVAGDPGVHLPGVERGRRAAIAREKGLTPDPALWARALALARNRP